MAKRLFLTIVLAIAVSLGANAKMADTGSQNGSPVSAYDALPLWFFSPTGPVGVSDPYLDEEAALNQAVGRALFMYMISDSLNLMSVYELYYHNETVGDNGSVNEQQSHGMLVFNAQNHYLNYEIAEMCYTEYNEAVVMLNVYAGYDDDMLKDVECAGDYMFYFDGAEKNPNFGDMMYMNLRTPDEFVERQEWTTKTEGNIVLVYSNTDTVQTRILDKWCRYTDGGTTSPNAVFQTTRHGLWRAMTDTFVQSLSNFVPRKTLLGTTNKIASDTYGYNDDMDYHNKIQDLTRLVYKTKVSCILAAMSTENGNLSADWVIIEDGSNGYIENEEGNCYTYESVGYEGLVYSEHSKTKNEARRIAMMFAKNELAKMSKTNISSTVDDFTVSEEDAFYMRYCDSTQASTNMLLLDAVDIQVEEPEIVNGYYKAKMESRVSKGKVIPFIKRNK